MLLMGLFDSIWKKGMALDEGMEMLRAGIAQVKKRFILQQRKWVAKIITKDGVQVIPLGD
jgi:hypothetical protein